MPPYAVTVRVPMLHMMSEEEQKTKKNYVGLGLNKKAQS